MVATGRRADCVAEVAEAIREAGRATMERTVDVGDRASIDALRDAVRAEFGQIDILVNAAGITRKDADGGRVGGRLGGRHGHEPDRHAAGVPVVLRPC